MLQALLFDVDGTLAETEEAHRQAFNDTFAEFGLPWFWDAVLYRKLLRVAGGRERLRAYAERHDPACLDAGLLERIPELHRHKNERYIRTVTAGGVPLRPGITRLIESARNAGLRLAVATTTSTANVIALLDGATGGAGHAWFETLVCAEDAPVKKPDPQVYREALRQLDLPAAACLALEDSRNGVMAARAAGIAVVVSESVYTAGDDFTGAAAVYPDFAAVTLADLQRHHGGWGRDPPAPLSVLKPTARP